MYILVSRLMLYICIYGNIMLYNLINLVIMYEYYVIESYWVQSIFFCVGYKL